MYHRIRKLTDRPLQRLNELARLTIEFGLTKERQDESSHQQLKQDFCDWFKRADYNNAGEWLWGHWKTIRRPLISLLALPLENKLDILNAYDIDTNVAAELDRPGCYANQAFSMQSLDERFTPALEYVNEILLSFYTDLLTAEGGVPGYVINEISPLTRQSVLLAYLNKQEEIHVCPGCDGNPPEVDADRKVYEDVDHFFPKALYPFLSIHPLNLTPLCTYCNQRFKGPKDPLKLEDRTPIPLSEACHPYLHNIREEIEIDFVRRDKELHLILVAIEDCHQIRLRSINYLIHLESRWDGDFQENYQDGEIQVNNISKPFADYYRFALDLLPDSHITNDWLRAMIKRSIAPSISRSVGQARRGVAAYKYALWVATDDIELDKWVAYSSRLNQKVEILPL